MSSGFQVYFGFMRHRIRCFVLFPCKIDNTTNEGLQRFRILQTSVLISS